jgi:hypothetical protein
MIALSLQVIINHCHSESGLDEEIFPDDDKLDGACRMLRHRISGYEEEGTMPNFRELKDAMEPFGIYL